MAHLLIGLFVSMLPIHTYSTCTCITHPLIGSFVSVSLVCVGAQVPSRVPVQLLPCERDTIRSRRFSELKYQWTVPLHESIFVAAACSSPGRALCCHGRLCLSFHSISLLSAGSSPADLGMLHMLTGKLPSLYSLHLSSNTLHYKDLFPHLPSSWGAWRPDFSLAALTSGPHNGSVLIHEAEVSG